MEALEYIGGTWFLIGIASFALKTFPPPENIYGKWFLGVAQFAVFNWEKGHEAIGTKTGGSGDAQP